MIENTSQISMHRLSETEFYRLLIESKYGQKYIEIINNAKSSIYESCVKTEIHHILPRAYGGTNNKKNLIKLSCKDHLLAHLYLALITKNIHMFHAVNFMFDRIFNNLDDIEKVTIEQVENFAKIRELSKCRMYSTDARMTISKKAEKRWKKFKESGRIDEVKKNISNQTIIGMKESKHVQIKTRVNLNSKWYYNEKEDKEMHWYEGMDDPDPIEWRRGRRPFTEKTKAKLKDTLNKQKKKFYHNDELKINTTFNTGDIIPNGWEPGKKMEYCGNRRKKINESRINKLNELQIK